jgi:hypothetical protein
MTRNTTSTRTLAHYDVFTSFTTPANTNSFLDNAHYQHIKTEARRKMLTKEPLKSLILDGVSIQLHVPQVYYEVKGGDKQQVPLPLSPESMAHIPRTKVSQERRRSNIRTLVSILRHDLGLLPCSTQNGHKKNPAHPATPRSVTPN